MGQDFEDKNCFASNVRPSFFGGVVSTRLQAQNLAGAIVPKQTKSKGQAKAQKDPDVPKVSAARERAFKPYTPPTEAASSAAMPKSTQLSKAEKEAVLSKRKEATKRRLASLAEANRADEALLKNGHFGGAKVVQNKRNTSMVPKPSPALKHAMQEAAAAERAKVQKAAATRKPDERRTATGQRVLNHHAYSATPAPSGTMHPKGSRPRGSKLTVRAPQSASRHPEPTKVIDDGIPRKECRKCRQHKPHDQYFVEKRVEGGLMHMCSGCASANGLSGVLYKPPPTESKAKRPSTAMPKPRAGAQPEAKQFRANPAGAVQRSAGSKRSVPAGHTASFYMREHEMDLPPAVAAVRHGLPGKRKAARENLDEYDEDFVVDDGPEADWRAELASVTRGFYREERDEDIYNDRSMEASLHEMAREEARSRKVGRQEDIDAEREEAARLAEKEERLRRARKKPKRKKSKKISFVDDEASDDSDEDEDEEDYE